MQAVLLLLLLHLYVGWRLVPDLPAAPGLLLAGLLAVSAWLIPRGFFARRGGRREVADRWTWAGMTALGAFSMLGVLTLLRDGALALLALTHADAWAAAAGPAAARAAAGFDRASAAAVPLLAAAGVVLGFWHARRTPRVKTVEIAVPGLPAALHGFTVAQISDLHIGPTVKAPFVQAVVDRVNAIGADAVALTGDLVDGRVEDLAADAAPLAGLRARHGVFFVTGNHEYYSGALPWIAKLRELGATVLLDAHRVIEHGSEHGREHGRAQLVIAGVADWSGHHFVPNDPAHRGDPAAALAGAPADAGLRLLLAHQPRHADRAAAAGFDVQLSGHTHGGQFWPWGLFVPLQQPTVAGLSRHGPGGRLQVYTSRGTGYWGPPLRLGAPSEITRIRFVAEAPAGAARAA